MMKNKWSNFSFFCLFFFCSVSFFISFMNSLKLASLNINCARDYRKRAKQYELIKQKHVDVMFIQETHSDLKNESEWMMELEGKAFLSHSKIATPPLLLFTETVYVGSNKRTSRSNGSIR